jgi:hypothetical protein
MTLAAFAGAAPGAGTPVLVELFTSEGCSSCPPADQLLMELDRAPRVGGAEVIALGEHVDYWNRLGWADPFSAAEFTRRQGDYARRFSQSGVYTPQMVVDGGAELVGSDRAGALRAIAAAAARPKAAVTVVRSGDARGVAVRIEGLTEPAEVFLAVTESGLGSRVLRGENAGRSLAHTAVVRSLTPLGVAGAAPFAATAQVALGAGWKPENLKAVVFAQGTRDGRVLGAAQTALR